MKKKLLLTKEEAASHGVLHHKFFDLRVAMMVTIGVLLLFTFIHTFVTNPTVSGMSVYNSETQDTERFSGTSSLLLVVFAFFALAVFIYTRKFDLRR